MAFNVNNLPFTEPMLSIWAQLVNLAGSKIEKQRMKSPNQGLSGIAGVFLLFFCFVFKELDILCVTGNSKRM